jgi:CTP-dependent riboflavin kinase
MMTIFVQKMADIPDKEKQKEIERKITMTEKYTQTYDQCQGTLDKYLELRGNVSASKVFEFLKATMNSKNIVCVSVQTLAKRLDISERSVTRANKYLVDNDWLQIRKTGTSNVYFLNPGLVWKDKTGKRLSSIQDYDANTFYFTEFEAKVVIGSDEQEDFANNI